MALEDDGKPKIVVAGVGGAGCNTINRLMRMGVGDVLPIAFNTDKKHLEIVHEKARKVLLGASVTRGLGAGGFPEVAQKAALVSKSQIAEMLAGTDILFIAAGMGGGTGTGASPVIAQVGKEAGALVVALVTFPFAIERARLKKAQEGLNRILEFADTVVVIDNNRLAEYAPNVQIEKAFELADEITARAISGIARAIFEPSLVNLDFADLKTVMSNGGISMIAVGEGHGYDKVEMAVENTLKNRLLDADVTDARGVLVHISGGTDITIGEVHTAGEVLTKDVAANANVILGARAEALVQGKMEIIAIFTGVGVPLFLRK
ncbi:cell division protein FtsZ [Candidatus Micrarchaeota archaeon]|nr:cell division protein FtsZ [Candidatus Micrarchaeota archaeon]